MFSRSHLQLTISDRWLTAALTASAMLFLIAIGLGPLVAHVPLAALAGILIKVGIDVIDWRFIKRLHRAPRIDLVLMLVVLGLTIFVNVITADSPVMDPVA